MSQVDICKLLKNRVMSGDDRYYSIPEIVKILLASKSIGLIESSHRYNNVNDDCKRLAAWGVFSKRKIDGKMHYKYKKSRLDDINL